MLGAIAEAGGAVEKRRKAWLQLGREANVSVPHDRVEEDIVDDVEDMQAFPPGGGLDLFCCRIVVREGVGEGGQVFAEGSDPRRGGGQILQDPTLAILKEAAGV